MSVVWVVCLDPSSLPQFKAALRTWDIPVYLWSGHIQLPSVHIIAFNDGIPLRAFQRIMDQDHGAFLLLTDFKVRRVPASYYHSFHTLAHYQCGGVSDVATRFSLFSTSRQLISDIGHVHFPTYPSAPVSSIINRTVSGRRKGYVPKSIQPCSTAALPIEGMTNAFYGLGLYPLRTRSPPSILAPCVYPSTPWTLRRLKPKELGQVFDLPSSVLATFHDQRLRSLLASLRYPLKCHSVFLQHLFYYRWDSLSERPLGLTNDGVGRASSTPPPDGHSPALPADPLPSPGGGTPAVVVDVNAPNLAADDIRKAVALKADNAPVPVHVWRTQLERILNLSIPIDIYEAGADRFRDKLLRMWRRGLFRDFWIWAKNYHSELRTDLSWCTGQFDWSCRGTPVRIGDATGGGVVYWDSKHRRYTWFKSKNNRFANIGKRRYKKWWNKRVSVLGKSRPALKECLEKAAGCSWWKWDLGSRLFFWRWPPEFMEEARDGCKCWYIPELLPNYRVPQSNPSNPDMKDKIREKLADVLKKIYMDRNGEVKSLTSFFDVMKGLDDIRMVYNGTSCGLNAACWAPWFPLPTVRTHLRTVEAESWLADIDQGEMFLNFLLDERLRAYAGVDLTLYFPERLSEFKTTDWARWTRLLMGFCASPYFATRCLLRSRGIVLGRKDDEASPFQWSHAVKNFPGTFGYNPLKPMVYKVRKDGNIASDLHKYIDDLRVTSFGEGAVWEASMRVMTKINWLGMQNAARKYREGSKQQGAWAGAIVHTPKEVTVSISQSRWDKVKLIVNGMLEVALNSGVFDMKALLSDRGVLTYVSQTYPATVPFLKGMHLTVDSWRPGRDSEGWKLKIEFRIRGVFGRRRKQEDESTEDVDSEIEEIKEVVKEEIDEKLSRPSSEVGSIHPTNVRAVPRLVDDLRVLARMFESDEPTLRFVRAKSADMVKYAFGDASGDGYGSGIARLRGRPNIRHGKWGLFYGTEHTSSNYRELKNVVDAIELDYKRGLLDGFELFFFTDNEVAEKAFYKGTSSSRTLFDLILRLRLIEMEGRMVIHVIHVSGKRMIASGIDGLSRGDTGEGIAAGANMESFVPLHLDVVERSPKVLDWISGWWPEEELGSLKVMELDDWFIQDESHPNVLWTPAPAGGESAVEEMANWVHHSPDERIHLMIIPTVWTCKWRKQLGKICDVSMALPNLFEFWNHDTHFEPLTLGIFVPYINRPPWRVKDHPIVDELVRKLRKVREDTNGSYCGNILRKFLIKARSLRRMP